MRRERRSLSTEQTPPANPAPTTSSGEKLFVEALPVTGKRVIVRVDFSGPYGGS